MNKPIYLNPPRLAGGASLVVVLILLLVMTLLGLAILRSTVLEERMSANLYDRTLAFQSAESALREAERDVAIDVGVGLIPGRDCTPAAVDCPALAVNAFINNVPACVPPALDCWINGTLVQTLAPAGVLPQYYIEFMGQRDSTEVLGQENSANANQYGGSGGVPLERLFRITARSHDPSLVAQRSVVVLQVTTAVR